MFGWTSWFWGTPVEIPVETPVELPVELPVETPVGTPVELPVRVPIEIKIDAPTYAQVASKVPKAPKAIRYKPKRAFCHNCEHGMGQTTKCTKCNRVYCENCEPIQIHTCYHCTTTSCKSCNTSWCAATIMTNLCTDGFEREATFCDQACAMTELNRCQLSQGEIRIL